jgi:hypothetical protein
MIVHAAGESAAGLEAGTHAVALHASPEELGALERELRWHGVAHAAIREPDPPWCGALMAIGVTPARDRRVRRLLAHLPLVRGKDDHDR